MEKQAKIKLHNRIRIHVNKYHRIRKLKDKGLPLWKEKWNRFNEAYTGWLEKFVEKLIPWLVLLLLLIILGEFSSKLNFFSWAWIEKITAFFIAHQKFIEALDRVIVAFFIADLYFNFFKKKTAWVFLKTSFFDILSVAPLGLLLRAFDIGGAKPLIDLGMGVEKEAAKVIEAEQIASRSAKAGEIAKAARLRAIARLPRFLRLYRISEFLGRKRPKKIIK